MSQSKHEKKKVLPKDKCVVCGKKDDVDSGLCPVHKRTHTWFSSFGEETKTLVRHHIDPKLGEVILFPGREKFPLTCGYPQVLMAMGKYKKFFWELLPVVHAIIKPHIPSREVMCPEVREVEDSFNKFLEHVKQDSFRTKIEMVRDVAIVWMQHDDSYRLMLKFYFSACLDSIKFKINESDIYWLSTKETMNLRDRLADSLKKKQQPFKQKKQHEHKRKG